MDYMKYMTLFNKVSCFLAEMFCLRLCDGFVQIPRKTSKQEKEDKEVELVDKSDTPEASMLDSNLWFNVTVGKFFYYT